jgi:hypothetical protein
MASMGRAARAEYEAKYTPETNYKLLMDIYQRALAFRHQVSEGPAFEADVCDIDHQRLP